MQFFEYILESAPLFLSVVFATYFYLVKGVKSKSNRFLALFFLSFAFVQSFLVFSDFTDQKYGRLLLPLIVGGSLIIPPSMYFYVNSLTINVENLNLKKHFSLGSVFFILNLFTYVIIVFLNLETETKELFLPILNYTTLYPIIILFPFLSLFYIYISIKSVQKHQLEIGDIYSYEEGVNLQWVKVFLYGFGVWFLVIIYDGIFNYGAIEDNNFIGKHTYDIVTAIYVAFIGLKALQQLSIDKALANAQIYTQNEIKEEAISANENLAEESKFIEIWNKVEVLMNSKKPYKRVDLSIYDLAKEADTNYKYLSKAINQISNQNFANYINSYRVEESKNLLTNAEFNNYTIEALAEMSGFKSKSAFNTAFKKKTGLTPSQYKKEN